MKIKYFTIIALFSTSLLLGQSYIPMLVEGNQWNVMYYDESYSPEHTKDTWETIKYTVGADATIEGLKYSEIKDDNETQLYREDTTEKKIYIRHETDDDSWDELLYDFSMKPGDTLNYYRNHKEGEIDYTIRVDSIVDVELGHGFKTRKFYNSYKLAWENEFHPSGEWIEGMGTFYGIYPIQKIGVTGNYITITLLCFKKNDVLIYMNPDYESCDENSNAIDEIDYNKLIILSNPVDDYLSVELPEEEFWTDYVITNISGKNILSSNNIKKSLCNLNINVSKLQSGLYFIHVKNIKGKFAIGKFIVN